MKLNASSTFRVVLLVSAATRQATPARSLDGVCCYLELPRSVRVGWNRSLRTFYVHRESGKI